MRVRIVPSTLSLPLFAAAWALVLGAAVTMGGCGSGTAPPRGDLGQACYGDVSLDPCSRCNAQLVCVSEICITPTAATVVPVCPAGPDAAAVPDGAAGTDGGTDGKPAAHDAAAGQDAGAAGNDGAADRAPTPSTDGGGDAAADASDDGASDGGDV